MNKFYNDLTKGDTGIMEERALLLSEVAKNAHDRLLNEKKQLVTNIKLKLDRVSDISRKDKVTLQPAGEDFDADKWVNEIQDLEEALVEAQFRYDICLKNHKKFFGAMAKEKPTKAVSKE